MGLESRCPDFQPNALSLYTLGPLDPSCGQQYFLHESVTVSKRKSADERKAKVGNIHARGRDEH